MIRAPHRNHSSRLRDFSWKGRRCVSVENATLRALFCPDKGCDLIELLHKPTDTEVLYQSPRGLGSVHDAPTTPLAEGLFRDVFPGGWYIMLPNGPRPCVHRGAQFGYHGEATFLGWDVDIIEDHASRVEVAFSTRLRRVPLAIERHVELREESQTLVLRERVVNEGAQQVEILWGHHPTFGGRMVGAGARVHLPACTAVVPLQLPATAQLSPQQRRPWPMLEARDGSSVDLSRLPDDTFRCHDFVQLENLSAGWFAVSDSQRRVAIGLRWDEKLFPVLGYWRLLNGGNDYPWYGSGRLIALEPATDLSSLFESAARGTAIKLAPGEAQDARFEATLFAPPERISMIDWGGRVS